MTIVITFALNAGLTFALGLAVAKFLGPETFGRYAVALAVASVVNTAAFEWLRLSATRFYSDRTRRDDAGVRATLTLGYAAIVLTLAALLAAAALLRLDLGLPTGLLAAATVAGVAMGLFDYQAALARARFLDRTYAALVLAKNALAFALMVGGAFAFGDPALVLYGSALSALAAIVAARRALADPQARPSLARGDLIGGFARYALPLVAASFLYQLIPLLNRGYLASRFGFAEAGTFSLPADLGLRLFATLGTGMDMLLFQIAVRTDETHGPDAARAQVARNLALVAAVLFPVAAGFWLVLPSFEALVVPAAFRGGFAGYMALLIPALLALSLVQYALNPVFQLRKATGPVTAAAVAALVVDAALLPVLSARFGPLGVAAAQAGGFLVAAGVLTVLAARATTLPWRDLALAAAATAAMTAALWRLRALPPGLVQLTVTAAAGVGIYGALALAFDIAGARAMAARLRRHRFRSVPAE
jgi:O-antigen/teichoic acid export membrane protein